MKVKIGTTRIVILTKKYAYKFPLFLKGILANQNEFENYIKTKQFVAKTEKKWWGLKQERLFNIVIYPRHATKAELALEHHYLYSLQLHNRIQIGQDKFGFWKFFDYEEIKWKQKRG